MRGLSVFLHDLGLSFPFPEPVLEILTVLVLSFTQMCLNLLRHLLAILVRSRAEGILFALDKLCHLYVMKRNKQSPGSSLMSPRFGRHVIKGVPYRD